MFNRSDGKEFLGSIYQKINKHLDGAMSVTCTSGNSSPIFSLGGLYRMDEETQIKVSLFISSFTPTFVLITLLSHSYRLASTTRT